MPMPTGENQFSVNRRYLWFGNTKKMDWLPMPTSGMPVSRTGYTENGVYENGGGWGFRSAGSHAQYQFDFEVREASGYNGLDKYTQFASGYYGGFAQASGARGTDLMLFADPATFDQNVLPPHWATPMLALQDNAWHHIGPYSARANTIANSYDQPSVTVSYAVDASTHFASMTSPRRRVIVPIPPTHKLSFGWSGTRSGTSGVGYSTYNNNGTITDFAAPIAPINTGATANRIGTVEVSGATAYAAEFYLKGTAAAQTISVVSMMAQLIPLWETTDATGGNGGAHIQGLGHTGCIFASDANVEDYKMIDTQFGRHVHYKGMSTTLKEVGGWLPVA